MYILGYSFFLISYRNLLFRYKIYFTAGRKRMKGLMKNSRPFLCFVPVTGNNSIYEAVRAGEFGIDLMVIIEKIN